MINTEEIINWQVLLNKNDNKEMMKHEIERCNWNLEDKKQFKI